jgi:hypothetical protein
MSGRPFIAPHTLHRIYHRAHGSPSARNPSPSTGTKDGTFIDWASPSSYLRPTRHVRIRPDYSDALFYLAAGALAALWVVAFLIGRMS